MAALGAELTLVPSEGGLTTKKLILDMIEAARRLSQEPHTYWTDQLNNHDSIAGYSLAGRGDLESDERGGRRLRPLRGHGGVLARGRHRAEATQAERQDRRRRARGVLGACWGVSPGRTRSKAWGSATRLRSGSRRSWTRSCRSGQTTRRTWRGASRGRRPSSRGRLPEPTSSPRFKWPSGWAGRQGGHADGRLRPEVPEHRRVPAEITRPGSGVRIGPGPHSASRRTGGPTSRSTGGSGLRNRLIARLGRRIGHPAENHPSRALADGHETHGVRSTSRTEDYLR